MPQYSRVEFPMLNVVPLRQAEPGMELEKAAYNREGRVIAESGQKLTEDRLSQLENLNVRKIVVMDTNVHWIPNEDAETYSGQITILETREFDEASGEIVDSLQSGKSIDQLRKIALYLRQQASRAGDDGGVAYLDDIIEQSYELEEKIEELTDRLEDVEDEQDRQKIMDALEGRIRRVDEMMIEVSSAENLTKDAVNAVGEKKEIRASLSDYVTENPEVLEATADEEASSESSIRSEADGDWNDPVSTLVKNDVLEGINEFIDEAKDQGINSQYVEQLKEIKRTITDQVEEKNQLKNQLSEFDLTLDQRKTIMDALEGRENRQKTELLKLPVSQEFASKTCELTQEELDTRYRLWEVADEMTDGDLEEFINKTEFLRETRSDVEETDDLTTDESESWGDLTEEELYDAMDSLENKENLWEGVEQTARILEESEQVDSITASEFRLLAEKMKNTNERITELEERIRTEVDDDPVRETILEVLHQESSFEAEEFFELNASMSLLEDVADCVTEFQENQKTLWNTLNDVTDHRLYDDSEEGELGRIQKKIEDFSDRLTYGENGSEDSGGTTGRAEKSSLIKLLDKGDTFEIANHTGLDASIVKDARECLATPTSLDSDQKFHCDPLIREGQKIFYGRKIDEDSVMESARDLADLMVDHSQPLKMLLEPPAGDCYILSHAINTCLITLGQANHFSFDDEEILDLTVAGLSMDLGMIEIPTGLWAQNEELSQRGYQEVKKHPELSRDIADEALNGDSQVQDLVHQHHERANGSGYPQGLEKDEQHPLVNIVGVCDAYIAMLEKRAYREAMSPDAAMMTLLRNKDKFDKSVVKALVENIGIYPNGSVVLLSDMRLALVKSQKPEYPTKPDVLIITDRDQNQLETPVPTSIRDEDADVKKIVKW